MIIVSITTLFFPLYAWAQQCEINFDEKTGLFEIHADVGRLISAQYIFWGTEWAWTPAPTVTKALGSKNYDFKTDVQGLGLEISGTTTASEPNQMNWQYSLLSKDNISDVIGGGIVFNLNIPDNEEIKVELLPDNTGWAMQGHESCGQITVRFSDPVKRVYFERGNRKEIRVFFYEKNIKKEKTKNLMSVTLPAYAKIKGTINEQLGAEKDFTWHKDMIHPDYSPVDLSYLNEAEIPAGKRGFLKANGDSFVFEDSTPARFWGTNLQAYALFRTSPSQMKNHAKRLSKLGFNLVRIHHHDSPWVSPNIFGKKAPDTLSLARESLKILDLWIKVLKDEGIYIWLDLSVERSYTENDGITNYEEITRGKSTKDVKGFNYINDDVETRMKEFNETYLNHVNQYTSLAYKDDPAIINVLITNENDLTHHFGNSLLGDKNVPKSSAKYMNLASAFASKHNLPANEVWKSWLHGPSKIFLNDLEHKFNQRMTKHLKSIGVKSMITTTNTWGAMPISSLPALSGGDMIDVHSYGRSNFFKNNPRANPNYISWVGAGHVNGKPLSVSEWNIEPFPVFDRFAAPVYMAAVSALQGWDALMQYGYSQQPLNGEGRPSNYTTFNDPASMALMPVSALIYRAGHVKEAINTYALSLNQKTYFDKPITPRNSATIRTLIEQSKFVMDLPVTKELPWMQPNEVPENVIKVSDYNQDFIPEGQNHVTSDTGELIRNWADGTYIVNTNKSQVAMGWIGGKNIPLKDITINLQNKNAAVAVQSLDDNPITSSERILISFASRTEPSDGNAMPYLSEPLNGSITVNAKPGLKLYLLNKYGKELDLPTLYKDGEYLINVDKNIKSYWMILKKDL